VLATGPGRQAFVQVIDGATGGTLFQAFPFDDFTGGAFVAAGDMNGDGVAELVITPDEGGGPRLQVYSGASLLSVGGAATTPFANFFGGNMENRGGVKVAAKNLNGDKFIDVVTGGGLGDRAVATAYSGAALLISAQPAPLYEVDLDGTLNGVFVG
jgi:hypothetical protein